MSGGPEALDDVRSRVVTLALDEPELSPRELAVRFTDAERYFVSEAVIWPEGFQDEPEDRVMIELDAAQSELFDCDIEPDSRDTAGPLRIRVSAADKAAVFEVVFSADTAQFEQVSGPLGAGR